MSEQFFVSSKNKKTSNIKETEPERIQREADVIGYILSTGFPGVKYDSETMSLDFSESPEAMNIVQKNK